MDIDQTPSLSEGDQALLDEQAEAEYRAKLARLDALGDRLLRLAQDQVSARAVIEERWLEDIRQYNGVYSAAVEANLKKRRKSRVFLGLTRAKTNTAESRIGDLLFPTDDRNYEVDPTPVPQMAEKQDPKSPAADEQGNPIVDDASQAPLTVEQVQAQVRDTARVKAKAMEREIDDQLTEAKYALKARDAIHQACVIGTGVLKGPVVIGRSRKAWVMQNGKWTMKSEVDIRPWVDWVDTWNFFPDMSVLRMEDAEFAFERGFRTKREVMALRDDQNYITENIEELLKCEPKSSHIGARHLTELRQIHGVSAMLDESRYEFWSYTGSLKARDLIDCGVELPPGLEEDHDTFGCVEFCAGKVVKAYLDPMDNPELPYSLFVYERDETCIFGFGVPYTLRDPQRVANASWRMLLDNAGMSSAPQQVINRKLLNPANGSWEMEPGKQWYLDDPTRRVDEAFGQFTPDSRQAELTALLKDAMALADESTNLPLIAQGRNSVQETAATKTAQGFAMQQTALNTVLRRSVKEWDDGVTSPMITRFYHWNMQYSDKEEIKGDYQVNARGASALLSKEIQANNLMLLGLNFGQSPVYGGMLKVPTLLRKIVQAHHLAADELVLSDEEIAATQEAAAKAAQQGQGIDPRVQAEQMRAQAKMAELEFDRETRQLQAALERENLLIKLAQDKDISIEKLRTMLAQTQMKIEGEMAKQTQEVRVKAQFGSGL